MLVSLAALIHRENARVSVQSEDIRSVYSATSHDVANGEDLGMWDISPGLISLCLEDTAIGVGGKGGVLSSGQHTAL